MIPQVQPEITVGEYDVVDNGVVTSPGNRPITITLGQNLVIEFRFDYEGDGEAQYTAEAVEDKLIISLENFQAGVVMGGTTPPIGLIEPITIGQIFNRELLVHFQVSTSKSDNKTATSTLYYTFMLEILSKIKAKMKVMIMSMDDDLAGQLNEEIGEDVPLHNTKDPDEVFLTNKSRLRLALLEYKDGVQSLKAWVNPFVLLVTVGSILLVGDFQQTFGLPGEFWLALYSLIGIVGFVWLLYSIRQYIKNKDKAKIETVIGELKKSE